MCVCIYVWRGVRRKTFGSTSVVHKNSEVICCRTPRISHFTCESDANSVAVFPSHCHRAQSIKDAEKSLRRRGRGGARWERRPRAAPRAKPAPCTVTVPRSEAPRPASASLPPPPPARPASRRRHRPAAARRTIFGL